MENDPDRVPPPGAEAADAVPHADPVGPPTARDRPVVNRKDDALALAERHDLGSRLHAWSLFGEHELAAGKSVPGTESRIATCKGKTSSP